MATHIGEAASERGRAEVREQALSSFLTGSAAGLAVFFALGFNAIFPPRYVSWILHQTDADRLNDTAMMFVGWDYFRHTPWQFPPGLNPNYGMEAGSAIVYSDSIPMLAFPFKLLSPWLSADFQYFGIWDLLCLLLQGIFAAWLARRFISGLPGRLLFALFFVFSPVLMQQAWGQYSLMAQWILLWGIDLYLTERTTRVRWVWLLPAALAVMSSFYFVPMVLLIWAADAIKSCLERTALLRWLAVECAAVAATVLVMMWVCGFFAIGVGSAQANGFGTYGANLLGMIDPWGTSLFLQRQPHSPIWQGEGFSYLGLGMLLMCAIGVYSWISKPVPIRALLRLAPLAMAMAVMAIFSLSNQIAFGSHIILNLHNFWGPLGPIFRGSGRLFWPAYYGIWLGATCLAVRGLRPSAATAVLAVLLAIQLVDSFPSYAILLRHNATYETWRSPLQDRFWTAAARNYRQIVEIQPEIKMPVYPIAYFGAEHGIPTNIVHVNRQPASDITDAVNESRLAALREDRPDAQTLYIIPDDDLFQQIAARLAKRHGAFLIDGYNIIAPDWFAASRAR
jgi:Family of unknown function (DUF6311)